MPFDIGSVLTSALGSIIGSSTGVFIGFWVNRRNLNKLNQGRVDEYLKGLTNELSESMALLRKRLLQLMPDHLWQSVVNSGDVVLFPYEVREDLRAIYFAISKCNYQFTRTASLGDKFRTEADTSERQKLIGDAWKGATEQSYYMNDSTLSQLEGISQKEWFIKSSQYKSN